MNKKALVFKMSKRCCEYYFKPIRPCEEGADSLPLPYIS